LRFYGFDVTEIVAGSDRNLELDVDPKLAWALANRGRFPVDVNKAPREMLLRVPGLGVRNVDRILRIRRHHKVTRDDLLKLRVPWKKSAPFLSTADVNPGLKDLDGLGLKKLIQPTFEQLSLFDAGASALSGDL
jgi:predicted DNA-binding helix-hairpin-helix protein